MCAANVDLISEHLFIIENSRQRSAFFAVILVAKKWPFVISCQRNKRILRFLFADYCSQTLRAGYLNQV